MKHFLVAVITFLICSLSNCPPAWSDVVCWNEVPGAGTYFLIMEHDDHPNAQYGVTTNSLGPQDGVISWDIPSDPLYDAAKADLYLFAIGNDGGELWVGSMVRLTRQVNCDVPDTIPGKPAPEPAEGDFDCNGSATISDTLRHLHFTQRLVSRLRSCGE